MTSHIVTVSTTGKLVKLPDRGIPSFMAFNRDNKLPPALLYHQIAESSMYESDVIIYFHDDVTVHDEDWHKRLMEPFQLGDVVAVGMGGATQLANFDLYRKPFNIWNMARNNYMSNQTDAETHGSRTTDTHQVAVLDAFCMAVRRDWLMSRGNWPVGHLTHHCLDLWLGCEAARDDKRIYMAGISCTHHGGGTSTKPSYSSARWLQGGTLESDHLLPHKWLYNEYRDVLPIIVE